MFPFYDKNENSRLISSCGFSPFGKQEDDKGFVTDELGSPESLPELDRPPLRKIDQYIRPDCPCCSMSKRYTVAFLASIGKFFHSN